MQGDDDPILTFLVRNRDELALNGRRELCTAPEKARHLIYFQPMLTVAESVDALLIQCSEDGLKVNDV